MHQSLTPSEWADYYHKEMSKAYEKLKEAKKNNRKDDEKKYKEDMYFNRDLMKKWGKKARSEKLKNRQQGIYTLDSEMEEIIYDKYMSNIHKNDNLESLQALLEKYKDLKNKMGKKATKSYIEMKKAEASKFSKKGDCYRILSHLCLDKIKNFKKPQKKKEESPQENEKDIKNYLSLKCSLIPKKNEDEDFSEIRNLHKLIGDRDKKDQDPKKEVRKKDKSFDDDDEGTKKPFKKKDQENKKNYANYQINLSDSEVFPKKKGNKKILEDSDSDNKNKKKKKKSEEKSDEEFERKLNKEKENDKKREKLRKILNEETNNIKKRRESDENVRKKNKKVVESSEEEEKNEIFAKNGKQKIFDINKFKKQNKKNNKQKEKEEDSQYSFHINTDVFDNLKKKSEKAHKHRNEEENKEKKTNRDKYSYISLEGQDSNSVTTTLNKAIEICKNNGNKGLVIELFKNKKPEDYEVLKERVIYYARFMKIECEFNEKHFLFKIQ